MKDTIPPVISNCPSDQVVAPDAGANMATVSWTEPTATDNSGQVPGLSKSHNPPASFPANSITRVSYIFYDISGNFDSCAFTVQVTMPGLFNARNLLEEGGNREGALNSLNCFKLNLLMVKKLCPGQD